MTRCCTPAGQPGSINRSRVRPDLRPGTDHHVAYVGLDGGSFQMGDAFGEGYPADGERPIHTVVVSAFAIAPTTVTNAEFDRFTAATGYRTDAETFGSSAVFHLVVQASPEDVLGAATGAAWWLEVRRADWAHPFGPHSDWHDLPDHPVVHVSWFDAMAYCRWAGARLPTEAEWELAARGGLERARFAWGDELTPEGQFRCNIWNGTFPDHNDLSDGYLTTAPVGSLPPNGFGLYEVAGNVWEWAADWFSPTYYDHSPDLDPRGPAQGHSRVIRGGSYLCHRSYCHRYRVAARSSNTPESSSGNIGFRVVRDDDSGAVS